MNTFNSNTNQQTRTVDNANARRCTSFKLPARRDAPAPGLVELAQPAGKLHSRILSRTASFTSDDDAVQVLNAMQAHCERAAAAAGYTKARRVDLPLIAERFVVRYDPRAHPEPLTLFHSAQLLPITLPQLFAALRARRGIPFEPANAVIACALMDRFARRTGLQVTALMMHRLFVAAVLVSAKVHNDVFALNCDVARGVSLTLEELNELEMELLVALDFRCLVDANDAAALRAALGVASRDDVVQATPTGRTPSPHDWRASHSSLPGCADESSDYFEDSFVAADD